MVNNTCGYCQRTILPNEEFDSMTAQHLPSESQPSCSHSFHKVCVQSIPRCAKLNEIFCQSCTFSSPPQPVPRDVSSFDSPPPPYTIPSAVAVQPHSHNRSFAIQNTSSQNILVEATLSSAWRLFVATLLANAYINRPTASRTIMDMGVGTANGFEVLQFIYQNLFKTATEQLPRENRLHAARLLAYLIVQVAIVLIFTDSSPSRR